MTFHWQDYVSLAECCFGSQEQGLVEAARRSAISRAYYGVFCLSRNAAGLEAYQPDFSNRTSSKTRVVGVHKKVISAYKESANDSKKEIGLILDELRKKRVVADYKGQRSVNEKYAESAVAKAKEVLDMLATLPSDK